MPRHPRAQPRIVVCELDPDPEDALRRAPLPETRSRETLSTLATAPVQPRIPQRFHRHRPGCPTCTRLMSSSLISHDTSIRLGINDLRHALPLPGLVAYAELASVAGRLVPGITHQHQAGHAGLHVAARDLRAHVGQLLRCRSLGLRAVSSAFCLSAAVAPFSSSSALRTSSRLTCSLTPASASGLHQLLLLGSPTGTAGYAAGRRCPPRRETASRCSSASRFLRASSFCATSDFLLRLLELRLRTLRPKPSLRLVRSRSLSAFFKPSLAVCTRRWASSSEVRSCCVVCASCCSWSANCLSKSVVLKRTTVSPGLTGVPSSRQSTAVVWRGRLTMGILDLAACNSPLTRRVTSKLCRCTGAVGTSTAAAGLRPGKTPIRGRTAFKVAAAAASTAKEERSPPARTQHDDRQHQASPSHPFDSISAGFRRGHGGQHLLGLQSVGNRPIRHHPAVSHFHHAGGMLRHAGVVGHDQHGDALGIQLLEEQHDLFARAGVQVAGGLVRQQNGRAHHQGPRDRHPLLLAAGQLGGPVVHAILQPHPRQRLRRRRAGFAASVEYSMGSRTLSSAVKPRQQIEGLEDEPDLLIAHPRERLVPHAAGVFPIQPVVSPRGQVHAAQHVQQRRLSRAGRPR